MNTGLRYFWSSSKDTNNRPGPMTAYTNRLNEKIVSIELALAYSSPKIDKISGPNR